MDQTPSLLKSLIGICTDGHHGYQTAATHAGSMELKRFFAKLAAQRKQFGAQLVEELGNNPHSHGSTTGALHRGWIDLKDKIGMLSQADLLRECVRGEAAAVKQYEDALALPMLPNVTEVVAGQLAQLVETRDRLQQLVTDGGSNAT